MSSNPLIVMAENKESMVATPLRAPLGRKMAFAKSLAATVRMNPLGVLSAILVVLTIFAAIGAGVLSPQDPNAVNVRERLSAPGVRSYLLGSDELGRDILSRVLYGARISLLISISAVGLGCSVGATIGVLSAYFGGMIDSVAQRVLDGFMAFPMLILAISVVGVFGASTQNVILAVMVTLIPQANRVIRAIALSVKETEYTQAARALGCTPLHILTWHIVPQCVSPLLVIATSSMGWAIIAEASLSFLGVGIPPPTATWGGMLSGAAQKYSESAPWLVIFPGFAIALCVFAFNMLGDAVRDWLDPRIRNV